MEDNGTYGDWFAELPALEVTDTDFDSEDVPLELSQAVQTAQQIWPRVFPGL